MPRATNRTRNTGKKRRRKRRKPTLRDRLTDGASRTQRWVRRQWPWWLVLATVGILAGFTVGVRQMDESPLAPALLEGELVLWDELSPRLRDPSKGQLVSLRQRRGARADVLAKVLAAEGERATIDGKGLDVPRGHLVVAVETDGVVERKIVPVGDVSGEALLALGRPMMESATWQMRLPKRLH